MQQQRRHENQYAAVRREFILKVDGNRPIFYPLDYNNTQIHFLTPIEGFALSLLDGEKPLRQAANDFSALVPGAEPNTFLEVVDLLDRSVRLHPSQSGLGSDGLLEIADSPIAHAKKYDPREFVIDPSDYQSRIGDMRSVRRLDTPVNIYTVFTHRCFTRCRYCYAERKTATEMPFERWQEIIEEMARLGIRLASPDNGDTFAREDGIDLLECLLHHKMHFLLSTKAHVSRDHVRRLVEAGFLEKVNGVVERRAQLSVDAVDEEVARAILDIPNPRVDLMLETFDNFLAHDIMPIVKCVVTGINPDQPLAIVQRFYPRGARVFQFVRYSRSFHRHTDDLFVRSEHLRLLRDQFERIREQFPDVELSENVTTPAPDMNALSASQRQDIWDNRLGCGGGWYALGISAGGEAFLCEQMVNAKPFVVGNARTQSIEEIWNSPEMKQFIFPELGSFKGTVCYTCEEFEECMWKQGRCYRNAYFSYGSVFEPPPMCPKNTRPGLRLS